MPSGRTTWTIVVLSSLSIVGTATTTIVADDTVMACVVWGLLALLWLALVWSVRTGSPRISPVAVAALAAVPLLSAVLCLSADAVYSDDARRYRWDGLVLSRGVSPYMAAPSDPSWATAPWMTDEYDRLRRQVGHPTLPTIYPPGAQLSFGLATAVGGISPAGWKSVWLLGITLVAVAVWRRLDSSRERQDFLLALCSPIVLLHGIVDVHVDLPMALLLLLAILFLRRRRIWPAGITLALAIGIKYLPVLALPFLLPTLPVRDRWKIAAGIAATLAVLYGPFIGDAVSGSLRTYASSWQANSMAWSMLTKAGLEPATIRPLLAAMMAVVGIAVWRAVPTARGIGLGLTAVVFCSPVVHPWYLTAPIILLPVAAWRSTIVWGATMACYGVALIAYKGDGLWMESPVALAVEFVPVALALVVDLRRRVVSASAPAA